MGGRAVLGAVTATQLPGGVLTQRDGDGAWIGPALTVATEFRVEAM